MLNNVSLMGRLTAAPEIRQTANGNSVCNFTLAVQRLRKDSNGDKVTDFFSCEVWRKQAELFEQLCHKGSLIVINGILHNEHFIDKNGNSRTVTKVVVNTFYVTEKKDSSETQKGEFDDMFKGVPDKDELPKDYNPEEIEPEDDLPF